MGKATRRRAACTLGVLIASWVTACDGADHVVGSAAGGHGGSGGATAGAGLSARGGAPTGVGGTGAVGASAGRAARGGDAGATAANGGDAGSTAARGGATTGGTAGSAAARGGSTTGGTGATSAEGGAASAEGGAAGDTLQGGSAGTPGGSGPVGGTGGLPTCGAPADLVATGCITDTLGAVAIVDLQLTTPLPVTVTALDPGDEAPSACDLSGASPREFVLRTAEDRELRYFASLPGLPDDLITVGEELELSAVARAPLFGNLPPITQTVVLARGSDLVLFTMNTGGIFRVMPDLSAYGVLLSVGDPYCRDYEIVCGAYRQTERLFVTQGGVTAGIRGGETLQAPGLSVSAQSLSSMDDSMAAGCDPLPGARQFGGFVTGG